ncbi:alcohol dehydrogenase 2-like [Zeugodacus cucurbitae]|uniref:alcohol dehydrogenase 2-like n=1 Tax=Zeugodacus cucurbitae TaxID=28588 RepID=UPI0023D8F7A4|nr:alcohol dehydrogenase 2-like [Zeugodacus cucurbitae]
MNIKGKNVIYSGGFGCIGQACVKEFLKSGAKYVTIFDVDENKEAMIEFKKLYPGTTIHFISVDMRKKESITTAFKSAVEKMGLFDVLVNGCGIMGDSEVDLTIEINLLGLMHSSLTALPYMDKSSGGRGGTIVNISSVAGLGSIPLCPVYSAAQHGVTTFTRCLGDKMYYDRLGVRIITICPGFTGINFLKNLHSKVMFKFTEEMDNDMANAKQQSVEVCARNMIKVIETGKNGAVYMLDLGNIKEVTIPKMFEPTF